MNQEIKVSIGCRVTPEKKNELLTKAQEEGYNSFSQYLESLILKASSENMSQEEKSNLSNTDLDNIESRIAALLKAGIPSNNELAESKNSTEFLNIEIKEQNKALLVELINYLLVKGIAVSPEGALIGMFIPFLRDGRGWINDEEVTSLFLNRFEEANEAIVESSKNNLNDTSE